MKTVKAHDEAVSSMSLNKERFLLLTTSKDASAKVRRDKAAQCSLSLRDYSFKCGCMFSADCVRVCMFLGHPTVLSLFHLLTYSISTALGCEDDALLAEVRG